MTDIQFSKNNLPLINIIIPVYNVEAYLTQSLNSLVAQSFQNWQAICINDGSTDNSPEILRQFAIKDKRFTILNQTNQGVSAARNAGLKAANSEYIMFLDSDDILHPQCLEIAYNTIQATGTDICDFKMTMIEENKAIAYSDYDSFPTPDIILNPLQKMINHQIDRSILTFWKKIYKAKIARQGIFPDIKIGEDVLYSWQILAKAKKCAMIDNILYYYIQHPSSVSHKRDNIRRYNDRLIMNREFCKLYPEICKKFHDYPDTIKCLNKFLINRLFHDYVIRGYDFGLDRHDIQQAVAKFKNDIKTLKLDCGLLKLRFHIILLLLEKHCYSLGKILC